MVCPNCQQQINVDDIVCPYCGLKLKLTKRQNDWVATVTPRFEFVYELVPTIQGILIFIMTWIVGNLVCEYFDYPIQYVIYAMMFLFLVYIAGIVFRFFHRKAMKYEIYENSVLFIDNFLQHREYKLEYENVMDVEHSQTFLQRIFHIGTIRIYADRSICKGLSLYSIPNSQTLYKNLKTLIKNAK